MAVVGLDQVDSSKIAKAGGKGANLGELIKHGFPVPPGYIVCTDEYASFMEEFDLPTNDDFPDDPSTYLTALRERILAKPLPEKLSQAIHDLHQHLEAESASDMVYAVRSSATAEDMQDASFAGQHDTYYYVTAIDLDLMIKKCWASLWSNEAFSYRSSQGVEHRSVDMAVVIQEMVRSEVSGVTFTADPVSGSQSVVVTESSWGMGAAIVDGRVSPDQYLVDKASRRLTSIRIADKKFMVPAEVPTDQSSRLIDVPAHLRKAESLEDEQVIQVAKLAMQAEEHFGCPQDIEWALKEGKLYFLQSRPVTIMPSAEEEEIEGKYVLFKPLAENFTEPMMPLTLDLLTDLVPMMKIIGGRVYMKLDHIKALIPLKMKDKDFARLAYLSDVDDQSFRLSIPKLFLLSIVLLFNYLIMGVFNRRVANMPDDFMEGFRSYAARTEKACTDDVPQALVRLFFKYRFLEPAGHQVMLVNLVAPRYMLLLKAVSVLLGRWAPDIPEEAPSLLCSGTEGVKSTEMGREILALAALARETSVVRETILALAADESLEKLKNMDEGKAFVDGLSNFLAKHGHRAPKEFELASVRWEENPAQVMGMIRNYLSVDTPLEHSDSSIIEQRNKIRYQLADALMAKPFERIFKPRQRLIEFLINQARYYIKLRENSRFYHIMGFYAARRMILDIEQRLMDSGSLKCKDDIFYLHWAEVKDLLSGNLGWRDVEETIRARRMEYIRLTKLTPPKTVGFSMESRQAEDDNEYLSGQGASPGQYEGIARVILDPATDNQIKPGEILIAPYTDPAWTPLFLTAHAAVVEVGSYLSHAGTIAREYGLPCVVDVSDCTHRIQNGARILVDGTLGRVTLLDGNEPS